MKYILTRIAAYAKVVLMAVLLAVTFISVSFKDIVTLDSLPKEYASWYVKYGKQPVSRVERHKLSDYDYYYQIYTTSAGDTVILAPGEKKEVEDVSYRSMMKVMDNWAVIEYHVGYGDWVETSGPIQPVRKAKFAFKLPDFKHQERIVVASALPVLRKRNDTDVITSSVYFNTMREVSRDVDSVIAYSLKKHSLPGANEIFCRRQGKLKLRPFLSHLMYEMCGGGEYIPTLGAVSEANTLHLYSDNWLIDNKFVGINSAQLTFASFVFDDMAKKFVSILNLAPTAELNILGQLYESNRISYAGQVLDTQELQEFNYNNFRNQEEYLCLYKERCMLLNAPYGFSLWLGSTIAGVDQKYQQTCITLGNYLGTGLQMINDLSDFSPKNPHRYRDLKEGKLTFPIWLMKSNPGITNVDLVREVKKEVLPLHESALGILNQFPESRAKQMLVYALGVLASSNIYKDFV